MTEDRIGITRADELIGVLGLKPLTNEQREEWKLSNRAAIFLVHRPLRVGWHESVQFMSHNTREGHPLNCFDDEGLIISLLTDEVTGDFSSALLVALAERDILSSREKSGLIGPQSVLRFSSDGDYEYAQWGGHITEQMLANQGDYFLTMSRGIEGSNLYL